ncbi:unnamed protein product [Gongylonema pulchrum]|uniref:NSL complex protein NSL2 n=1 Tax=Gongylonema pulchrum TaxID=637853 RepID=A0A183EHD5_9BILA|nr:unnamed protein product [Gongylonema pulchrum]
MAKKWKKHCKKARHGCMWRPKECEHLTRSEMQENGANKPDAPQPEAPGDTFRPPGDINCDHEQHHHHPTLAQCRGAAIHQQSCPPEGSFDVYHRCDSGMSRMGCLGPPLYSAPKKHFCRRHNLHTHKYDKKLHRLEKKLGRLSMATDTPQLQ